MEGGAEAAVWVCFQGSPGGSWPQGARVPGPPLRLNWREGEGREGTQGEGRGEEERNLGRREDEQGTRAGEGAAWASSGGDAGWEP